MQMGADIYLLDIRAFWEDETRGRLLEDAFSKLDQERREKARRIGRERGQAESLGAGLLLQLAVREAEAARAGGRGVAQTEEAAEGGGTAQVEETAPGVEALGSAGGAVTRLTVPELLGLLDVPLPFAYLYGENGKPYFKNYPYYFNLSHSGDYVVCAFSDREVGADIQIHRAANMEKLAGRYFSPAEADALGQAEDREAFFFRLWARKEAYGKLTGRGLADALEKDLWSGDTEIAERLCWMEYEGLSGYSMAVCQFFSGNPGKCYIKKRTADGMEIKEWFKYHNLKKES